MENSLNFCITNNFLEEIEKCIEADFVIKTNLSFYEMDIDKKNFYLEIDFELTKLNLKYLDGILNLFRDYKFDHSQNNKVRMLALNDYILYDFKRLRERYKEMNELYFSLDDENKFTKNIKYFMDAEKLVPTRVGCMYLRLLNHYITKLRTKLKQFGDKYFQVSHEERATYNCLNNKILFLCRLIAEYLSYESDDKIEYLNKIIKKSKTSELNLNINRTDSDYYNYKYNPLKWGIILKSIFNRIYYKSAKKTYKNIFNPNFNNNKSDKVELLINYLNSKVSIEKENLSFLNFIRDIKVIKMIINIFESKSFSNEIETIKTNEIIYFSKLNLENFKLIEEKEGFNKLKYLNNNKCNIKIRILANQIIKINYENQNLLEKEKFKDNRIIEGNKIKDDSSTEIKDTNFFGLLLRISKDILTPSYNVIIHIQGGGFFSQTSESHLDYLKDWAKETDSIIISIDYKLTIDNKYPLLFDNCAKAYEIIIKYSAKLFSKYFIKLILDFSINKLMLYSDSVGCLIALDIIKNCINNKIRLPDAALLVYPYPNIMEDKSNYIKDSFDLINKNDNIEIEEPSLLSTIKETFIDAINFVENENDERLNFFLTDTTILSSFPIIHIISSANDLISKDSVKLCKFLSDNNVNVKLKNLISYSNGMLQINSLFDTQYINTLNCCLNFIQEIFNLNGKENIFKPELYYEGSVITTKSKSSSNSFY